MWNKFYLLIYYVLIILNEMEWNVFNETKDT